ncbi:MAG: hypothetical protein HKP56_12235 [Anderseniella sp.]|jgi:hypothetical protein|nr:hypothetical protein [Anderseniella sp.]
MLTMGQAAKLVSVGKAALGRAIKSGKISAKKNAIGGWEIDPADLFRVNPASAETVSDNNSIKRNEAPANAPTETAILMARLDVEIDWLKAQMEQVKKMRKQLVHMKLQSEKWQDEAQTEQRLLTDRQPQWGGWFGFGKAI